MSIDDGGLAKKKENREKCECMSCLATNVDDRLTIVKMDRMVAIMRRSFSVAGKQGCRMYTRGGERRGVGGARASEPVLKRDVRAAPVVSRPSNSSSTASHPPATSARHGGKKGSVFASYKALPYNTKLVFCSCAASTSSHSILSTRPVPILTLSRIAFHRIHSVRRTRPACRR